MTKNVRFIRILACLTLFSLSTFSSAREWRDVTGKHQFEAELIQVSSDLSTATMEGADGKRYEIPLAALCKVDRNHVITFARSAKKKGKPATPKTHSSNSKTWTNIPEDTLYEMKMEALRRFPNDKEKQFSFINASIDDYLGLPESEESRKDSKKKSATPTEGKPKQDSVAEQTQRDVPTAVIEMLTSLAEAKWPTNKRKRVEFVKKQLGYYYVLQRFEAPELPELAVIQLKQNASKIAPSDFKAQLRYVYQQVLVGREFLESQKEESN